MNANEREFPRFYPVLDSALVERRGMGLAAAAGAILDGGARILQLRHKGHFSRDVFSEAQRVADMCRRAGALFVINDRADMAMLLDCPLHVGQDDLPPEAARKLIGIERVLGFSTHNETQLRAAGSEPVDYVAFGPIFGTASKQNPDPVVGVEELRRVRLLTEKPLVAIGGITRATACDVIDAGADAVAVIGDLMPEECSTAALRGRTEEWLRILTG
jgi:thiamine-phosphate pyrophosphorylase